LKHIAFVSVHGCPLAVLGSKSAGGMNVYIRALAQGLGRLGFAVDIFTRRHGSGEPAINAIDANVRIVHIDAGPEGCERSHRPH